MRGQASLGPKLFEVNCTKQQPEKKKNKKQKTIAPTAGIKSHKDVTEQKKQMHTKQI